MNDQFNIFNTKNLFLQMVLLRAFKDNRLGKNLESTHLVKDLFLIYIKNPQNLTIKKSNKRGDKTYEKMSAKRYGDKK